ncbi:MAG: hypothetical protein GXX96_05100 [Planctomycetaceae bacterium]|nr:hypothetical protein [Planctomycetaceae bacterium]
MNDSWRENRRRLRNLLADRAIFGLEVEESAELDGLSEAFPDMDLEMMDRVAAICHLALGIATPEPLPAVLREQIRAASRNMLE